MSWPSMAASRTSRRMCESFLFASKLPLYRHPQNVHPNSFQNRLIFSTSHLNASWMDKIKGVITGKKPDPGAPTEHPFTLLQFADEMAKARKVGTFKEYIVGRSSEATFAGAFEKQEGILRYLGGLDPTGENIQISQKQEAVKELKCTMADIETTLAKYTWAKEAQKKLEKLKQEGKPIPKTMAEVQKLMGSSPLDMARSNMAKTGQISRNAFCPCGSKKRYKRCCGKD